MAWTARSIALVVALLLGACVAPPPTGPTVAALAPKDKDPAQFQQDDLSCRQLALDQLGGIAPEEQYSAVSQQQHYDLDYVQCMTARGNIAPVVASGAVPYGYPYYSAGYGYPYAYPYPYYPYPYAYPYAYPYGYPWYWGAPVGVGASFFFGGGHGHHGHSHGQRHGPHH